MIGDKPTEKRQAYIGVAGLFDLWQEAMSMYKTAVVENKIHYRFFVEDFINSRTFHDSTDSNSKNDHLVNLGRIRNVLEFEELSKKYSSSPLTEENFHSCMEDLLLMKKVSFYNDRVDFQCHFNKTVLAVIADAANDIPLFKEKVSVSDMDRFFNECRPSSHPSLHSHNNQYIAYFLCQMDSFGLIAWNYQYVIEVNRLLFSPKSGRVLSAHNLTCALTQINNANNPIKSKIDDWVKSIKMASIESNNQQ